jgi:hypothetical protein
MTYAGTGLEPTYITLNQILQSVNGSCTTREYNTPPPSATLLVDNIGCVHATLTISPLLVHGEPFRIKIAEMLGLPEYVVSTIKS